MPARLPALTVFVVLSGLANVRAQTDLSVIANTFLSSLAPAQEQKASFSYEDSERFNWNYVPMSRKGLALHDINESQKEKAMSLMRATLSDDGFRKASGVLSLEAILREVEGHAATSGYRDPQKYYLSFFGTPASDQLWGWRIEGHHISLNVTSDKGKIVSATPSFLGANPASITRGARNVQILKDETDLGFALVKSLSADQLKVARFSERALPEIVTRNDRRARKLQPAGITFAELDQRQQESLLKLLDVFVLNYELGFSSRLKKKIEEAGINNLSFAWAGSLQPGEGHYYRIQGPVLLIEYDNTQNGANHVHTVVRDLTNDFAEDILREHYERDHK